MGLVPKGTNLSQHGGRHIGFDRFFFNNTIDYDVYCITYEHIPSFNGQSILITYIHHDTYPSFLKTK